MTGIKTNNQMSPTVLTENIGKVALIRLNRPERLNAQSETMLTELIQAIEDAEASTEINAIVLTGNGKAFCAGVDLKDVVNGSSNAFSNEELITTFSNCQKPLIGAINGAAMTGGLELALCCDFLYASESAYFGDTHIRVGLMPTWGMSQKLPRAIGINRAREMSLSGDRIDAQTALQWGLVNKVFSDATLLEETLSKAQLIASHKQDSIKNMKQLINDGWKTTLEQGLLLEVERSIPHNNSVDLTTMMRVLERVKSNNKNT